MLRRNELVLSSVAAAWAASSTRLRSPLICGGACCVRLCRCDSWRRASAALRLIDAHRVQQRPHDPRSRRAAPSEMKRPPADSRIRGKFLRALHGLLGLERQFVESEWHGLLLAPKGPCHVARGASPWKTINTKTKPRLGATSLPQVLRIVLNAVLSQERDQLLRIRLPTMMLNLIPNISPHRRDLRLADAKRGKTFLPC
jgi:hypothetical protein